MIAKTTKSVLTVGTFQRRLASQCPKLYKNTKRKKERKKKEYTDESKLDMAKKIFSYSTDHLSTCQGNVKMYYVDQRIQ